MSLMEPSFSQEFSQLFRIMKQLLPLERYVNTLSSQIRSEIEADLLQVNETFQAVMIFTYQVQREISITQDIALRRSLDNFIANINVEDQELSSQQNKDKQQLSQTQQIQYTQDPQCSKTTIKINRPTTYNCGCSKSFISLQEFLKHIQQDHFNAVPKQSSHIIYRYHYKNKNNPYIVIKKGLLVKNQQKSEQYFKCGCSQRKFLYEKFISHVMRKHKGISALH